MAARKQSYGNDSISSLKGADRVRKRPGVIFGSDGLDGCQHAVFEILSNAIDEAREGHGSQIIVTRCQDHSIEVEDFGGGTMLVRAVSADVPVTDVEGLLCELADRLAKGAKDTVSERTEAVMHSIACKAAIKAGDRSDRRELMALAQDILNGKVPPFCPHGRPVVLKLTKKELEKQFGRLG